MFKIKYIDKNMRFISKLDFMSHYLSHLIASVRHKYLIYSRVLDTMSRSTNST